MLLNNRCGCARILLGTPLFVYGGLYSDELTLGTAVNGLFARICAVWDADSSHDPWNAHAE
jgi:hypothetical protein